jgi:hypothetical protein
MQIVCITIFIVTSYSSPAFLAAWCSPITWQWSTSILEEQSTQSLGFKDGDSMLLWNTGTDLLDCMVSQPRWAQSELNACTSYIYIFLPYRLSNDVFNVETI